MKNTSLRRQVVLFSAVAAVGLMPITSRATIKYWDINGAGSGAGGTTPTGNWDTSTANWTTDSTGGSAGTTWAAGDDAVFSASTDATGAFTVTTTAPQTATSITVEEGTVRHSGTSTNTLTTSGLTINSGATFSVLTALSFAPTANSVCLLNGGTIQNRNTSTGGSFFTSGGANTNMKITLGTGGGHVSANGGAGIVTIYTGLINGTGPLSIDGTGTFRLTTTVATYSGATNINGVLQVSTTANVLPSGTALTINSTGTFDLQADQTVGSLAGAGTLTNQAASASRTLTAGGDNTSTIFSGVIANGATNAPVALTKAGSGVLTLTGANTATGVITINDVVGNRVSVGNGGTTGSIVANVATTTNGGLIFNRSNDSSYGGVISGGGAVTKNGAGALDLTGANSFTGGFTLSNGTVRVGGGNNRLGGSGSAVTVGATGGTISTTDGTGRTLTYAYTLNGDLTLGQASGGTGALTLGGTVDLGGVGRSITVNNASDTISAVISNGSLTKNGAGILALTGTNLYTGPTTILNGQIALNSTSTLGDGTGTLNLSGGTLSTTAGRGVSAAPVPNPINMTANAAITTTSTAAGVDLNLSSNSIGGSAGKLTFRNDAPSGTGVFQPRFSGNGFNFARDIDIINGSFGTTKLQSFNTSGVQTFSGTIGGDGSYNRSAGTAGTGATTVFTGANTYSGGTTINDGTLRANNATGSATGTGAITINTNGTLDGTGGVSGAITSTGKISPGDPAVSNGFGTLKTGDVTSNAGGSLLADIDVSNTPAADLLDVTGAVSLTGSTLSLTLANAPAPDESFVPQTYIVVNNDAADAVTGTFDTIFVSVPGYKAVIDTAYTGTDNLGRIGDGNDIAVTVSVPEPAAFGGLMMGGLALLGRRRRVKAN